MKILVVDDDETIRKAVKRYLEMTIEGADVTTSWCGNQAQGHLRNDTFDLIITDLMMSNGDGISVLRWCKNEEIETPIIVNTSETERDAELIRLGAETVVHKDLEHLEREAKRLLNKETTI